MLYRSIKVQGQSIAHMADLHTPQNHLLSLLFMLRLFDASLQSMLKVRTHCQALQDNSRPPSHNNATQRLFAQDTFYKKPSIEPPGHRRFALPRGHVT